MRHLFELYKLQVDIYVISQIATKRLGLNLRKCNKQHDSICLTTIYSPVPDHLLILSLYGNGNDISLFVSIITKVSLININNNNNIIFLSILSIII